MTITRNIVADYTLAPSDDSTHLTIAVDTTSGPITLTLPPTDAVGGATFSIQLTGPSTNLLTLTAHQNQPVIQLNTDREVAPVSSTSFEPPFSILLRCDGEFWNFVP